MTNLTPLIEQALKTYKEGEISAAVHLCEMYYYAGDTVNAQKWQSKAFRHGLVKDLWLVNANLLRRGVYFKKDSERAFHYFKKAANVDSKVGNAMCAEMIEKKEVKGKQDYRLYAIRTAPTLVALQYLFLRIVKLEFLVEAKALLNYENLKAYQKYRFEELPLNDQHITAENAINIFGKDIMEC